MDNQQTQKQTWERIMMNAITERDSHPVGSEMWKVNSDAVEEIQIVFEEKFGHRFTFGTFND